MRNDNKAEKHHYVPQFLLRNFAAKKGQIYVFDKWEQKHFPAAISDTACQRNFNMFEAEKDVINAEHAYSFIEDSAVHAFKKIIRNEHLHDLEPLEIVQLSLFVITQFFRTPQHRSIIQHLNDGMAEHIVKMGHDPNAVDGFELLSKEAIKEVAIRSILSAVKEVPLISEKNWGLLKTTANHPFWLSDNPVVMHNDRDLAPYGNLGLGVPGIQIYMPITSTLALCFFCPSIFKEAMWKHDESLAMQSQAIGMALLGATAQDRKKAQAYLDDLEWKKKTNPELQVKEDFFNAMQTGRAAHSSAENVEFLNARQVMFSSRYVYSGQNDFTLVKRILSDKPHLAKGHMPSF